MANSFLFGTPQRFEQVKRFTPAQENLQNLLLNLGQQNLQNPLQGFDSLKNRANQRFQQETVPGLLERFSGSGSNALSSPSLKAELSQAGGTLQEKLASLENQYRTGREQLGLQQANIGLTPQMENLLLGGDAGALRGIGGGLSQGFGAALPYLLQNLYSDSGKQDGSNAGDGLASSLGSVGGTALAGLGGLGTLGTLGAGAAGAAGLYGLYKLLSYLTSDNEPIQIPGQQASARLMQRSF